MIGVRADGRKELVALADGYRESAESWADLLRDAARRGMRAPVLAMGDGALGFWGALREVFPARESSAVGSTRSPTFSVPYRSRRIRGRRRPWPRSGTPRTSTRPRCRGQRSSRLRGEVRQGRCEDHRRSRRLLAFYDYPAEHWIHLRTTNPIWVLYFQGSVGRCFPGQS